MTLPESDDSASQNQRGRRDPPVPEVDAVEATAHPDEDSVDLRNDAQVRTITPHVKRPVPVFTLSGGVIQGSRNDVFAAQGHQPNADVERGLPGVQGPNTLSPSTTADVSSTISATAEPNVSPLARGIRVPEVDRDDEDNPRARGVLGGGSPSLVSWTRNPDNRNIYICGLVVVVLALVAAIVAVVVVVIVFLGTGTDNGPSSVQAASPMTSIPVTSQPTFPPVLPQTASPTPGSTPQPTPQTATPAPQTATAMPQPTPEPTPTPQSPPTTAPVDGTLNTIETRGTLRCAIPQQQQGFSVFTGQSYQGFEVDLCRGLAAAIFGPDFGDKLQLREASPLTRFQMLQNDEVDVLAAHTTLTMQRDVYEPTARAGFSFSEPYLYDSLGLAGQPTFVDCAARGDTTSAPCLSLRICVLDATTYLNQLTSSFPVQVFAVLPTLTAYYGAFTDGICNVLAGGQFEISERVVRTNGYTGNYTIGTTVLSKEPLALTTRDGDPTWSDFVNWVLLSLMFAEEKQITQTGAFALRTTNAFGPQFSGMFVNAVSAVGNFGEMYARHLETLLPRQPINMINEGNSALIYAHPFGDASTLGRATPSDSTLELIRRRGWLRCGVRRLVGFAEFDTLTQEWSGLDVDFCRAISAAIFNGRFNNIDFIEVSATERFVSLNTFVVDVLCRTTTATFERDVLIPSVGTGFSFSQTTLYDGLAFGGIPPYGACADNIQTLGECANLKICVGQGTTTFRRVSELFADRFIVPMDTTTAALQGLATGQCNAVASDSSGLSSQSISTVGQYSGPYELGNKLYSKEPLTPVVRQDDPHFAAFVYWVVSATFYAEEHGITQSTASSMPLVSLFGNSVYFAMLRQTIAAVGNFGEIYQRNLGGVIPRSGANQLNIAPFGPQIFVRPGF